MGVVCYVWAAAQCGFAAASTTILFGAIAAFVRSIDSKVSRLHLKRLLVSLGTHQVALIPASFALQGAAMLPAFLRAGLAAVVFELVRLAALACLEGSISQIRTMAAAWHSFVAAIFLIPASLAALLAGSPDWRVALPAAALLLGLLWVSRAYSRLMDESEAAREPSPALAHNTADLVLMAEPSGEITFASPGFLASIGIGEDALLGRSIFDLVAPEDFARFDELFTPAGADGQGHDLALEIEGTRVEVEMRVTPVHQGAQAPERYIVQARDLTPRLRQESLRRRAERLAAVGDLAASIAHEFRNPLTTVMGFAQLLRSQLDELAPGAYEAVWAELERMKDVTDSLMVLAKPEAAEHGPCDLAEIAQAAVRVCEPMALEQGVPLDVGPLPSARVLGHPGQLRQMTVQLLRNAIEAAAETGGRVSLWIQVADAEAILHLRDTGPGIPEGWLDHLGEPQYRTREKGTGLGLMVVHRVVQLHGGHIRIWRTDDPRGTAIEVRLPRLRK